MAIDDLVSVDEAAKIIGCTDGRVRQMLIEGRLEGQKLNKRAWGIRRAEAERLRDMEYGTGRPRVDARKNSA